MIKIRIDIIKQTTTSLIYKIIFIPKHDYKDKIIEIQANLICETIRHEYKYKNRKYQRNININKFLNNIKKGD